MGLIESKSPFQVDSTPTKPQIDTEIGISQMLDPRSPSTDFERTPVYFRNEKPRTRGDDTGIVVGDPRSPSNEINRTPITANSIKETKTDEHSEDELQAKIQRLGLYDTPILHLTSSSDSLSSSNDIINSQETILKLLEEEPSSLSENVNAMWLSNITPGPQSRSTPKEDAFPDTSVSSKKEDNSLLRKKRKQSKVRGKVKNSQLSNKELRRAFVERTPRSPLAVRNGEVYHQRKSNGKKNSKTTALMRYKKYESLDESLVGEIFPGKENTDIVW